MKFTFFAIGLTPGSVCHSPNNSEHILLLIPDAFTTLYDSSFGFTILPYFGQISL